MRWEKSYLTLIGIRKLPMAMGVRAPSLFHNLECNCIQIRNFECTLHSESFNTSELRLLVIYFVVGDIMKSALINSIK